MSSITDKPISLKSEDLLNVEKYSNALSNFIIKSDTPITVGLQGEWGTGKTSLMSLLLEDFNSKNILVRGLILGNTVCFEEQHQQCTKRF
jgi:predicted KAP-like P-loop ATPase